MNNIRVRFAPSPTGHLHLGGLRAALFNWLFARHYNGTFLLRIEDTDIERSKPEYTASILEALKWAKLESDEPIFIQSQHIERHKKIIDQMLKEKTAYKCYCAGTDVVSETEEYRKYEGTCRDQVCDPNLSDSGRPFVVRFKVPAGLEEICFNDLIHGPITFSRDQLDDFIIIRSDGTPVYNFVVVMDDVEMGITHILRGEEHISNTPKQILLYQACKFKVPEFGHLPLILGPDGTKLSKRQAATAVIDYKKNGFLADALCNYLVRLGWSHGDQEIFSRQELVSYFSLDHIGKKGAIFDIKKLEWLNGVYIRETAAQDLLYFIERDIDPNFTQQLTHWSSETCVGFIDLYKERVKTLKELMQELKIVHDGPGEWDETEITPLVNQTTINLLTNIETLIDQQKDFSSSALSTVIKNLCQQLGLKLPDIAKPIRIALTGKSSSPGIFEMLSLLGKETVIKRVGNLKEFLNRRVLKKH